MIEWEPEPAETAEIGRKRQKLQTNGGKSLRGQKRMCGMAHTGRD